MFATRKMKMAMAVAAVAVVGAVAPAMASADTWSSGGTSFTGPAQLVGTLTTTAYGTAKNTCSVVAKANLDNGAAGGVARGQISDYLLGIRAGGTCTTALPNCSLSFTVYTPAGFPSLPSWPIVTSGQNVTVSGIAYGVTYNNSGGSCPLAGVTQYVQGSMTGTVASGTNFINFSNSPGLTTTFGSGTTSGTLGMYAQNAAGNWDPSRPITLQP